MLREGNVDKNGRWRLEKGEKNKLEEKKDEERDGKGKQKSVKYKWYKSKKGEVERSVGNDNKLKV